MAKHAPKPTQTPAVKPTPKKHPPFRCHDGRVIATLEHVIVLTLELEIALMALSKTVTDALDSNDAKLAAESAKIDAFIAAHQGTSAADEQALVDRLNAQGAVVDANAAKLA
jgi:hypothetical protein